MASPETEFEVDFELKERAMDEAPVGITISDPDREDNPLVYINEAFERLTGFARADVLGKNCRFLQGEGTDPEAVAEMREAIEAEEPVTVEVLNYRADGEAFWNEITIAPLRNAEGEVTNYVGFQSDVTARKEAEFEVERERRNLDHLLSRIRGLIGDVTRELVRATDREGIENEVCDRVAGAEGYTFAWIGRPDLADETLVPSAWAGDGGVTGDDLAVGFDDDHPAARAVETREITVAERAGDDGRGDLSGVAAVPLVYRDTLYGVLTVYADRVDALDEREAAVLEALGRAIATSINAVESRRILSTDNVVELEFEVRDDGLFFVDLSARCDCRLEYQGSVYRSGGSLSMFFSSEIDPTTIIDEAAAVDGIGEVALVSGGEGGNLFEFRLAEESIVTELAERGVQTRSIVTESGAGRITMELPAGSDSRSIARLVRDRYPDTELVAYRERERPPITKGEFISELEERLTDRQLTALQKAYVSGYYDWNRSTSGDELAESMDISRSTFHQHLRAAERKLVEEFFDR